MSSIPVLGLPILNKPELMDRMLSTVDVPVDRLYVVDNGGVVGPGAFTQKAVRGASVHVVDPGFNLGVAASWNLIIRANLYAPWWLIVNNDISFERGTLSRFLDTINGLDHSKPQLVCIEMGNESWGNHFGAFAPNAQLIEQAGWFDEHFNPIYFEDTEYKVRLKLLGIEPVMVRSRTHHDGNQSWKGRGTEELAKANAKSWDWNGAYYTAKVAAMEAGDVPVFPSIKPSLSRLRETDWPVPIRSNR